MDFDPSPRLYEAIKEFEGFRSKPYRCPGGHRTQGWGHRTDGKLTECTAAEAEAWLKDDVARAARGVRRQLGDMIETQGQMDALTDMVFNIGEAKLSASTLFALIRRRAPAQAVRREILRWTYAGGRRQPGLERRRLWDAETYFS